MEGERGVGSGRPVVDNRAMTSPRSDPAAVAQVLLEARRNHVACDAIPVEPLLQSATDAYAVQALVDRELTTGPAALLARHWKSGGPSREAVLTHAPLPADGVVSSPADLRARHFNGRLIEAEIALRLGRNVTPQQAATLTLEEARSLVDAMAVSIEIVDSRWQQGAKAAPALLKLADLQSHGALVLGDWRPFEERDWFAQTCSVRIGNAPAVDSRGVHSLGDPAWLLPTWLRHATRDGAIVPVGTVVTTGTWCGMLPAAAGDRVTARFEGIGEASVQL